MDFEANNDDDYAKLKALVDGLEVAVLVNNVGASHSIPILLGHFRHVENTQVQCFGAEPQGVCQKRAR